MSEKMDQVTKIEDVRFIHDEDYSGDVTIVYPDKESHFTLPCSALLEFARGINIKKRIEELQDIYERVGEFEDTSMIFPLKKIIEKLYENETELKSWKRHSEEEFEENRKLLLNAFDKSLMSYKEFGPVKMIDLFAFRDHVYKSMGVWLEESPKPNLLNKNPSNL